MPLLAAGFQPPRYFRNPHVQTIGARFVRRVKPLPYDRQRVTTTDGDFIDLDWLRGGHERAVIMVHGLESSTRAPHIQALGRTLATDGWDIIAMNFRSCSGESNRLLRSYHSGVTEDLAEMIQAVQERGNYPDVALVGFSLGGNVLMRYLGEQGGNIAAQRIRMAAAISVPMDLAGCAENFKQPANSFYMKRFLRSLCAKVRVKREIFPDAIDYDAVLKSENFHDFDGRYTAPVHGFDSAEHYWDSCSAGPVASQIALPTLLLNAMDDPFLTGTCHVEEIAECSEHLFAEISVHGGHVGFVRFGDEGRHYYETRVREFFRDQWEALK